MSDILNVKIRVMQLSDVDEVAAIEQVSQINPWSKQQIQECLDADYSNHVLTLNNNIIGYAFIAMAGEQADLLTIAIKPTAQRQGYGRQLMKHLIKVLKQYNVSELFLEVRISNVAAIALYQQLGFKEVNIRRQYYQTANNIGREDAKVMMLKLK